MKADRHEFDNVSPDNAQVVRHSNALHFGFSRMQRSVEDRKPLESPGRRAMFPPSKARNSYIQRKANVRTPSCDDSLTPNS